MTDQATCKGAACCAPTSNPDLPFDPESVAPLLLDWYGREGRELPWRGTRDPYRVWLSEIMLQQTGVATVIPYYQRFLERFPTVLDLAAAELDAAIELWAGLGYYSRARNLHAAARKVTAEHGGRFPETLEALQALPGVGRSTAGAIRAIAFDRPGVILDGNVRRVLCRLLAVTDDPRATATEKELWRWAEALTPENRSHDYAQAIMDLGATLCTPRRPDCPRCPLAGLCRAKALGLEDELPRRAARKSVPTRMQVALLLERDGRFLVRQRPFSGMLGGLWEFPASDVAEGQLPLVVARRLLADLGLAGEPTEAGRVRHVYSHFKLDLRLYRAAVTDEFAVAEGVASRRLTAVELADLPLHGAHKKVLSDLIQSQPSTPESRSRP
ncbi:A/G-specific adenine glycosylase [Trichloromonas acetexigens]|uniref:A/G-specific adenine glycosylase n=1 Tax=Trichloromonas acetexigens TaxID=38815 RepID=UPI001F0F87C8|nr:A/G-specific adenine glycosylase [Desulfuromonas acetexigens]